MWASVFAIALIVGAVLALLQRHSQVSADSLLGIIAHGSLALGLVVFSFSTTRVDLNSYLFGDLLAVTKSDLLLIAALGALIALVLHFYWNQLLAVTVHAELAAIEGINVDRLRLLQLLLLALLVAVAMKVVGVLLVTALLIMPANCARPWSRTPEQMVVVRRAVRRMRRLVRHRTVDVARYADRRVGCAVRRTAICAYRWMRADGCANGRMSAQEFHI